STCYQLAFAIHTLKLTLHYHSQLHPPQFPSLAYQSILFPFYLAVETQLKFLDFAEQRTSVSFDIVSFQSRDEYGYLEPPRYLKILLESVPLSESLLEKSFEIIAHLHGNSTNTENHFAFR